MNSRMITTVLMLFMMSMPMAFAGQTSQNNENGTRLCDSSDATKKANCGDETGMPVYSFKSMLASLSLRDTPLKYMPPVGGSVAFSLFYNAREAGQPAEFNGVNVGPKWTTNWISYIEDDPASAGSRVKRIVAGGGAEEYSGYSASTGEFAPQEHEAALLVRVDDAHYELRHNDGRIDEFSANAGETSYPRRVYLSKQTDPQGNSVTLHYDSAMRLVQIEDALGQQSQLQYENINFPLAITRFSDPFGRTAEIEYDNQGRLIAVTDAIGMTSRFQYEADSDFITKMSTPYGDTTFSQTRKQGGSTQASIQATDPMGFTERTEYRHDAPGIAYSESKVPAGLGLTNAYMNYRNAFFWNKRQFEEACTLGGSRDADCDYTQGFIKHFLHNKKGQTSRVLESTKAPLERRVWFTYAGQSSSIRTGTLDSPSSVSRVLDDGSTQAAKYSYNAKGKITKATDPAGRETTYTYASNDIDIIAIEQSTENGKETLASLTWNAQHLPLTITDAAGQTTTYTYNAKGQPTTVTNALGQTTRYQYDNDGYLTRVINAAGRTAQQFTYDNKGRVASVTDSEGYQQTYQYDALNRITDIGFPDGTHQQMVWDKLDVVKVIDRENRTTQYAYDANRNLTQVTDALGQTTHYTYYPDGTLNTLTDAAGNTTTWERDIQGRVISKRYQDNQGDSLNYDSAGRLVSLTDAKGQTTQYQYTLDNQMTQVSYHNADIPTPSVTFEYDANYPRLTAKTDGQGTTLYHYYAVGQLGANQLKTEVAPSNDVMHSYQFDELGRPTQHDIAGVAQSIQYDVLGRVTSQQNALGVFQYAYLGDTQQSIEQQLNASPFKVGYQYETNQNDRRLKNISHITEQTKPGTPWPWPLNLVLPPSPPVVETQPLVEFGFVTRADGNITQRTISGMPQQQSQSHHHGIWHLLEWLFGAGLPSSTDTLNGTTQYQYDDINRLLSASKDGQEITGYHYDAVDNLVEARQKNTTLGMTHNELNQIVSASSQMYQHDANGNLVNDGLRQYQWDAADRLVRITHLQSGVTSEFAYDGFSRRVTETERDSNGNIIKQLNNIWCDETLCAQLDEQGNTVNRLFAQGEVQNDQPYLYMQDQLGSVYGLVKPNGTVAGHSTYDPYGNLVFEEGAQPMMAYAGLYKHDASDLYLATYRAYDPATARWLNRDPIREAGGLNLYAYVSNDPINYIDPLGLWAFGDPLPQGVADFATGVADAASLGLGPLARSALGVNGGINRCSTEYSAGQWASLGLGAGRMAYAGIAKAGAAMVADGAAAMAFRNGLKRVMRGPLAGSNYRIKDYGELMQKYGSDQAIQAAAGRTNSAVNAVGANLSIGGTAGAASSDCECQ